MTGPLPDIGHNSGASRKALYIAEITKAMNARKAKRLEETFTPQELGALTSSDRIVALKHGLLDNIRVIYATHPNLDVLPGVVLLVSIFSDHGGQYDANGRCILPPGSCTYSMTKMARFFSRSERAIREALHRAVECGALNRSKPIGGKYSHWPVVFRSILDPASSPTWFIDASLPVPPVQQGTTGSLLPVCQPVAPEASFLYHRKPPSGDHRKPDDNVLPRVFPRELPKGEEPPTGPIQPKQPNGQREMNLAFGGEAAYAEVNITITPSGALEIGHELRNELRKTYTDEQINAAIDCTLAAMGADRNRVRIMQQIRRQCVFRKSDADKGANRRSSPHGSTPSSDKATAIRRLEALK